MPSTWYLIVPGIALVAVVAAWAWLRRLRAQREAAQREAVDEFNPSDRILGEQFLAAAAATGKPRGLRWKACELAEPVRFAADRVTGELYALVAATISFDAIEGGGMEEVEAVSNLRSATAVFVHRHGAWSTDGRVVFNLDPNQAVAHYQETLAPVAP